jgi:hypothetical protein
LNLVFHAQLLDLGLVEDLDRDRVPCDGMSGEFDLDYVKEGEEIS